MQANLSLKQAVEAARHLTDAAPPWDALLDSTRRFLGGDSATFIVFDPAGGLVVTRQHGVDPEAEREYIEHYHAHDIMTARTLEAPQGTWFDSARLSDQGLQVGERDYLDYMHRHRMRQMVGLIAIRSPELQGGFTIQRSSLRTDAQDWRERADVRHFATALQAGLASLHRQRQDWISHAQSALEGFGEALCILSAEGRILHASPLVAGVLSHGQGLRVRQSTLWHPDAGTRAQLESTLQAVVHTQQGASMALHDASGQLWAHMDMTPAPAWIGMGGKPLILARIRPMPVSNQTAFQQRLIAAFDLTPSEARVLDALVHGQSMAEHARQHGRSIHTVRAQTAALRHKMGCSRQVDLVRKALQFRT